MKIKILKEAGSTGYDHRDPMSNKSKHYPRGAEVQMENFTEDLLNANMYHFYDKDGCIYKLNSSEYITL
jgi:hypothetical protein